MHDADGCALLVNVFDGGPRTRVSYRVGKDDWRPMQLQAAMRDPWCAACCRGKRTQALGRADALVAYLDSAFIQQSKCAPQRVELRIIDEYGRRIDCRVLLEQRSV